MFFVIQRKNIGLTAKHNTQTKSERLWHRGDANNAIFISDKIPPTLLVEGTMVRFFCKLTEQPIILIIICRGFGDMSEDGLL
jgi:hypothetical protein